MHKHTWSSPIKATDEIHDVINALSIKLFGRDTEKGDDEVNTNKRLDPSLATGGFGLALLAGYLDRIYPENGWDNVAHSYMDYYSKWLNNDLSLFSGLSGAAFTARYLSRDGERYKNFIKTIDNQIHSNIPKVIKSLKTTYILNSEFDLVSGAVGIGAYLLQAGKTQDLLKILNALSDRITAKHGPMFYHGKSMDDEKSANNYNSIDTGMAHGMAGVLALLSYSITKGDINGNGVTDAIRTLSEWFLDNETDDGYGINWPYHVNIDSKNQDYSRTAWCYGPPGISAALYAAGSAINEDSYKNISESVLKSSMTKPPGINKLGSSTFCHGFSGLLQIFSRAYNSTKHTQYKKSCETLLKTVMNMFDDTSQFGYKDINNGVAVDTSGILNGSAGVLMAILAGTSNVTPEWDRMFLLS